MTRSIRVGTLVRTHAGDARSRVEIEGESGDGMADDERIEWVRLADDDLASQIADAFNAGYAAAIADCDALS